MNFLYFLDLKHFVLIYKIKCIYEILNKMLYGLLDCIVGELLFGT